MWPFSRKPKNKPAPRYSGGGYVPASRSADPRYDSNNDLMNPLNPLSPISPFSVWNDTSPTPSHDSGSSCSSDYGSSSSSYDSGSSSSCDSGGGYAGD